MVEAVAIETKNGIEITFNPSDQKYQATINGRVIRLKSLNELRKRCAATFEPTKVLIIQDVPDVDSRTHRRGLQTTQIRGVSEHTSNYGQGVEYRLQIANNLYGGQETRLTGDMYVYDADLEKALQDLEEEGRAYLAGLTERWRLTVSELGRKLRIEDLMQGKAEPAE